MAVHNAPQANTDVEARSNRRGDGERTPLFGEDGFTFGDVLDMVNPLQHIPILNGIYRRLTGDEISTGSRLAGGAIFGGAIGFASAMINSAVDDTTGRDIGEHVMALFWPEDGNNALPDDVPGEVPVPPTRMASAPDPVPSPDDDLTAALMAMASPVPTPGPAVVVQAPVRLATPVASRTSDEPAFLSALPSREAIAAARAAHMGMNATAISHREMAGQALATDATVLSLSPAAMDALLASLSDGELATGDNENEDDARTTTDLAQSPAGYAAWQAAMEQRMAATR